MFYSYTLRLCVSAMLLAVVTTNGYAENDAIQCSPPPLPGNIGNVNALKTCITTANILGGGVIDLGGLTYTLTAIDNTTSGNTGLPVISSIIHLKNGTIVRDASAPNFRLLLVNAPGSLSLTAVTLENGNERTFTCGGAIRVTSNGLMGFIKDSTFKNNQSDFLGGGLCIDPGSSVNLIKNTSFEGNSTVFDGGAISLGGTAEIGTIVDSIFSANFTNAAQGGAIAILSGSINTIARTTFIGNRAGSAGGAIDLEGAALLNNVDSCTFSSNLAINPNDGGGAIFLATPDSVLETISNSTFNNNEGGYGGAIHFDSGTISTIVNTTFNQNVAYQQGGAIYLRTNNPSGVINQLFNTTIAGNIAQNGNNDANGGGAGIYNCNAINEMQSNIVAENVDTNAGVEDDVNNCGNTGTIGTITTPASYNLIGVAGPGSHNSFVEDVNGNEVGSVNDPLDPDLGVLMNNGGPTLTMALLSNSPAIGAGSNPLGLQFDQRGEGFLRTVNGQTDMGAYQTQPPQPPCPCHPDHPCQPPCDCHDDRPCNPPCSCHPGHPREDDREHNQPNQR